MFDVAELGQPTMLSHCCNKHDLHAVDPTIDQNVSVKPSRFEAGYADWRDFL